MVLNWEVNQIDNPKICIKMNWKEKVCLWYASYLSKIKEIKDGEVTQRSYHSPFNMG